jgi:hypothetical protein
LPSVAIFIMIGLSQSSSSRRVGPRPELTMPKLSAPTVAACHGAVEHLLSVSFDWSCAGPS